MPGVEKAGQTSGATGRRAVVHSAGWAFFEASTLISLSVLTLLVTARLLGPQEFGIAAAGLTTVQLLNIFVEGLFAEALIQRQDLRQHHIDSAFWTALGMAFAIMSLCAVAGGWIAALYKEPRIAPILIAASIALPFCAYTGIAAGLLRRRLCFRRLAMRTFIARVLAATVAIVLALKGAGAWSLVAQYLTSTIIGTLILFYWESNLIGFQFRSSALRELLRFVIPWLGGEVILVTHARLFQLAAGCFLGVREFGFLNLGFRLIETASAVIQHLATNVGMPFFARLQKDFRALSDSFLTGTQSLCAIAMPAFVAVALCARSVIVVMLGPEWLPSVPIVQALATGTCAAVATTFCYTVFTASGRPKLTLICGLCNVSGSAVLLAVFSSAPAETLALIWSIRQFLSAALVLGVCCALLDIRLPRLVPVIGWPMLVTAGIGALLWVEGRTMLRLHEPEWSKLIAQALTAGVGVILAVAASNPDLVRAAWQRPWSLSNLRRMSRRSANL